MGCSGGCPLSRCWSGVSCLLERIAGRKAWSAEVHHPLADLSEPVPVLEQCPAVDVVVAPLPSPGVAVAAAEARLRETDPGALVDGSESDEEDPEVVLEVQAEREERKSLLLLLSSDVVRCTVLSSCACATSVALRATCRELAEGACDRLGRLLTASAVLPAAQMALRLRRVSPQLLARVSLPGITGDSSLAALVAVARELHSLRDVSVRLAAPRLPRVTGESRDDRARSAASLAQSLRDVLPEQLRVLDADLRGGCLLAGENALPDLVSTIPKGLERLCLDLNHYNARDARAVASAIPDTVRELRILFHGRSFVWLGVAGSEDTGLEALASAMPRKLRKLHLMLECTDDGAAMLCHWLPKGLDELDLDLHLVGRPRPAPERLPQVLASSLSQHMVALRLRFAECVVNVKGLKLLADAMPRALKDLRLDLCGRDVGNEGVEVLARAIPNGLSRLALCLRTWRFTEQGARALGNAVPRQVRRLKIVLSSSPIGVAGVKALVQKIPLRVERLNLSFRLCGVGAEGERALRPLARRWNPRPHSWVRVHEKSSPICQGLEDSMEWELWDD